MRAGVTGWPRVAAVVAAGCLLALVGGCGDGESAGAAGALPVVAILGETGINPGQFTYPRVLTNDGQSLWAIDKSARVQRFDPKTGRCTALWKMPEWELGKPVGFTIAPGPDENGKWCDELLYIADTHYNRLMVYRPPADSWERGPDGLPARAKQEAVLVKRVGKYGMGPGEFIYPTDVAVLLKEDGRSIDRIYVSEYGGDDRVSVFDGGWNFLFSFGTLGSSSSPENVQFDRPQSLAFATLDGVKQIVITDARNHRVGRFTLDGKLLGWIGSPETAGEGLGCFRFPYGLCVLEDGTALVSEFGGNRVQQIDLRTGAALGSWGRTGRGDGEIAMAWAVAVLGDRAYVVDGGNNRVMAFAAPRR